MQPSPKDAEEKAHVRALLQQVLPTAKEVTAFCANHFPRVRAGLRDDMDWAQQVDALLAQVAEHGEIARRLREFAPNARAWGPQRALWPYVLCGLGLILALLGGFLAWRMTMARRPQSERGPAAAGRRGHFAARSVPKFRPGGAPWYVTRHKEPPCRLTALSPSRSPCGVSLPL